MITFTHYKLASGQITPSIRGKYIYLDAKGRNWKPLTQSKFHPPLFELASNYQLSFPVIAQRRVNNTVEAFRKEAYAKFLSETLDFFRRQILSIWHSSPHVTVFFQEVKALPADTTNPPGKGFVHFTNLSVVMGNQPAAISNTAADWIPLFYDQQFIQDWRNFYMVEGIMEA